MIQPLWSFLNFGQRYCKELETISQNNWGSLGGISSFEVLKVFTENYSKFQEVNLLFWDNKGFSEQKC